VTTNAPPREFWIDTDEVGAIVDSTDDARFVLGHSRRHARGLRLPIFFAQGGPSVTELQQAMRGRSLDRDATLQGPVQPLRVHYHIELRNRENRLVLRWTFERL
jgi:hypothetical protein